MIQVAVNACGGALVSSSVVLLVWSCPQSFLDANLRELVGIES